MNSRNVREEDKMSIQENLIRIKSELPSDVTLVAVSKFHPASDIEEAYRAGQRVFGESRPQELRDKCSLLPEDIEWHFIGHLQANKIKYVVPNVRLIHSCDSEKLLLDLESWCKANGYHTEVLLELHIATEETKQGFSLDEVLDLLDRLRSAPLQYVKIRGVMGMATFSDDEALIRMEFGTLSETFDIIASRQYPFLTDFNIRSFGMSGDWKIAVQMGATHVRIGTSIFGERRY